MAIAPLEMMRLLIDPAGGYEYKQALKIVQESFVFDVERLDETYCKIDRDFLNKVLPRHCLLIMLIEDIYN